MRKLIFILIALISFSQAQTIQYIGGPTTTVISKGNFRTDSIFYLPKRTKLPTDTAAFRYQISDSSLYVWSGYQWIRAGGSGSINGTLTTNYIPKATGTATIGNSLLYTSGNNLMFNSTTPYTTNSGWSTSEVNASSVALNVWKINDTARGYIAHNGTLMEINNLRNGDLTFVTNSSTRGRFTSGGDFRVNTLGGTGSRVVVASSNGTLSAGSSATDLIDTTYISSRAWRQKGVDSVQFNVGLKVNISDTSTMLSPYIRHAGYGLTKSSQALSVDTALIATRLRVGKVVDSLGGVISTKGSGTVTSVATGYGLSGGTINTTGTLIADTLNLSTRAWRQKGLDSLAALEISGSGTTNYVPKFTNTRELGNSVIYNAGGLVGINTASPVEMLSLSGGTGTNFGVSINPSGWNGAKHRYTVPTSGDESVISHNYNGSAVDFSSYATSAIAIGNGLLRFSTGGINSAPTERARFNAAGRFLINTTSDAGAYTLQNNGALYNTGSAILAATSGSVGIGLTNPNASAKLDITSTTQGFLPPRMTTTQRDAISSPAAGLVIYNTTTSKLQVYTTSWTDLH